MTKYHVEPNQEVIIDAFKPEYAEGIVKCFKEIYGDGYPIDTYYKPEKLIEKNKAQKVISAVARTINGDIVGHAALINSNPCNLKMYETAAGVVIREYRNRKLLTRMVKKNLEMGIERGVEGVYSEPVCNNVYGQKIVYKLEFITTAIEVDLMPAQAYTKEGSASGRVSLFWCFKTLLPKPHKVYLPEVYKDFFHLLYNRIDDKRELSISHKPIPEFELTILDIEIFEFANVIRMAVKRIGNDFQQVLKLREQEAKDKGVVCFQILLDLSNPCVGEAVNILRENGYFIGGLFTRWFDSDGMLMQKLLTEPCWKDINIAFEHDEIIVETAYKDWLKVNK